MELRPITPARAADLVFVRDSWRKSYRHSPGTYAWPRKAFDIWMSQRLDELLPRCSVHVARPSDWPEGILGWIATEQRGARCIVHWSFVKEPFRREGIGAALFATCVPAGSVYSAKSFHAGADALVRKFGLRFDGASTRKDAT